MPEAISSRTAKLLKDLTGAPDLDAALLLTLRDAVEHRLEDVESELDQLEEKWDRDFESFEAAWEADEIENRHGYDVESDYWEWEELVTRRETLEDALTWLP